MVDTQAYTGSLKKKKSCFTFSPILVSSISVKSSESTEQYPAYSMVDLIVCVCSIFLFLHSSLKEKKKPCSSAQKIKGKQTTFKKGDLFQSYCKTKKEDVTETKKKKNNEANQHQ